MITIKEEENNINLFELVFNKLIEINKNKGRHKLFEYNIKEGVNNKIVKAGETKIIQKNNIFKKYAKIHNFHNSISTLKIRNVYSNEIFKISKDEKIVSLLLSHDNISVTKNNYIKENKDKDNNLKFSVFLEILDLFAKNKYYNDWVEFQNSLDINNKEINEIVNKIKDGYYDTIMGKCIDKNKEENQICDSYLNCFSCKNYSVIGEKDLWKIISFNNELKKIIKNDPKYEEVFLSINNILKKVSKEDLLKYRKKAINEVHPFWKNPIIIKTLIENKE